MACTLTTPSAPSSASNTSPLPLITMNPRMSNQITLPRERLPAHLVHTHERSAYHPPPQYSTLPASGTSNNRFPLPRLPPSQRPPVPPMIDVLLFAVVHAEIFVRLGGRGLCVASEGVGRASRDHLEFGSSWRRGRGSGYSARWWGRYGSTPTRWY